MMSLARNSLTLPYTCKNILLRASFPFALLPSFTLFSSFASSAFLKENVNQVTEDPSVIHELNTILGETEEHEVLLALISYCSETEPLLGCCRFYAGYREPSSTAHLRGTSVPFSHEVSFYLSSSPGTWGTRHPEKSHLPLQTLHMIAT